MALVHAGYQVVVLDNLANSCREVLQRIETISGVSPEFIEGDVRDRGCLEALFADREIDAVMHFAGLKAVGESVEQPLAYYDNNVSGTLNLVATMEDFGVRTLVFSSSATVYGDPASVPIREDFPLAATNPYGRSKLMVEEVLADWHHANPEWSIARLRYFNPVGSHPSGLIGEDPQGVPNNLMPFVAQVAVGRHDCLSVFGDDYDTADGTGVRDYIHVMDLVEGHVAALKYMWQRTDLLTLNLGTGRGVSVLEMIRAFERASGRSVPFRIVERRPGDIACCWADPGQALDLLGWQSSRDLDEMCRDLWHWQETNPMGYR